MTYFLPVSLVERVNRGIGYTTMAESVKNVYVELWCKNEMKSHFIRIVGQSQTHDGWIVYDPPTRWNLEPVWGIQ